MSRMFCYVWSETDIKDECKFGERWVKPGQDPEKEVHKRIKESLNVRKDRYKEGKIKLHWFGDVTEYAKKVCPKKCKRGGRVDDDIRRLIGFRKGTTGEIHTLDGDELTIRLCKILAKVGQPLPVAGLSTSQFHVASDIVEAYNAGKRTIVAELCARFGKTIWAGVLAKEINTPLTIITSYVLTSFTSFLKDLTGFEQFKDFVHVDTEEDDYVSQIMNALAQNKQVVAYVSLHKGSKREERVTKLFSIKTERLLIVDEADYGAHKDGQASLLQNNVKRNDTVVLMTGTNSDRATGTWQPDHMVSVTYPELLMEKALTLKNG